MTPSLVVGLTGGLASGKSCVARLFEELGVPVIDADIAAREVVAPGEPALGEIRTHFGTGVFTRDGHLDRARLRAIVFGDEDQRRALEAILHPRIRQHMRASLRMQDAPYAILVIPLLIETGGYEDVDRVLVVDAPRRLQLERAAARDGSPMSTLRGILRAQADRKTRLDRADDVIVNDATLATLRERVLGLHQRYLDEAARLRLAAQQ